MTLCAAPPPAGYCNTRNCSGIIRSTSTTGGSLTLVGEFEFLDRTAATAWNGYFRRALGAQAYTFLGNRELARAAARESLRLKDWTRCTGGMCPGLAPTAAAVFGGGYIDAKGAEQTGEETRDRHRCGDTVM